ncbi:MAG: cytochrome c3 family protein [Eggerthellaceae bacterium]|nr:cytochrome c3 family protein [Eggerthellaceae bacterium]
MSEKNSDQVSDQAVVENAADAPEERAPKKRRKAGIMAAVVAVVLVAAGVGMWVWHEDPSFCGTVCHTPMNAYYETYSQEFRTTGVDKYGNEVADTSCMLATYHAAMNYDCMDCHIPVLSQQVSEAVTWVSGNYEFPLAERSVAQLGEAAGLGSDEMCLNESCHNLTRDDLYNLTAEEYGTYNPHWSHHETLDCGTCHKAHRASVMYCSQCHAQAVVPDGWLNMQQANELFDLENATLDAAA